ncbi:MAG: RNA polymerase sigma factor [Armatimonadetes bacterium]|nr:RNA polymerase sigma factor [Armatimonadota bacterium]
MRDKGLVERVLQGDRRAAGRLVEEHYPPIYRFLTFLTGSSEEARELCQATFVSARQNLAGFRFESGLGVWIKRIAYNEFLKSKRGPKVQSLHDLDDLPADGALSADGIVLAQAVASLPDGIREAFVLREIDELSVAETAEVLGIAEGTVKSRCHLAKKSLRRRLASTWTWSEPTQEVNHATQETVSACDP